MKLRQTVEALELQTEMTLLTSDTLQQTNAKREKKSTGCSEV